MHIIGDTRAVSILTVLLVVDTWLLHHGVTIDAPGIPKHQYNNATEIGTLLTSRLHHDKDVEMIYLPFLRFLIYYI